MPIPQTANAYEPYCLSWPATNPQPSPLTGKIDPWDRACPDGLDNCNKKRAELISSGVKDVSECKPD
jgi:hypothetical protein